MSLEDPAFVVGLAEVQQGETELLHRGESPEPQELLLEGSDEPLDLARGRPLGAAVALGASDEGGAGLDAEEGDLVLEGVRDELASVVVAELEPYGPGDAFGEGA